MPTTSEGPQEETTTVRDPDLPFLAAKAAIELDNVLAGRGKELKSVRELAGALRASVECPGGGKRSAFVDPGTVTIINQAIAQSGAGAVKTVAELVQQAQSIATRLTTSDPDTERTSLEWIRAFCVALSRGASAYRQRLHDSRPAHPSRR